MQLSNDVGAVLGSDPLRSEAGLLSVSAVWAGVHGIAELMINGRLPLAHLEPTERGRLVGALLDRNSSVDGHQGLTPHGRQDRGMSNLWLYVGLGAAAMVGLHLGVMLVLRRLARRDRR